jgi:hypothetical protein
MMAMIMSIAIGDGFHHIHCNWQCCCCLLLLVAIATSSNAHFAIAAEKDSSSLN